MRFKIVIFILVFAVTLVIGFSEIFAQEQSIASESSKPIVVDSYTLFWPVVSGRAVDDRLFFIKRWRENFTNMFIFGNLEKADYEVQLSTKRIVEAERLLKENQNSFVLESLEEARVHLSLARERLNEAYKINESNTDATVNITNQLNNINLFFLSFGINSNKEVQQKINEVQEVVNDIKIILH